jgi:pyridoxal phosphate enzyme (YggS family)
VTDPVARRADLARNLATLDERIERACVRSARRPADLRLIVITKTFPAEDVRLLADLGITDVGENRDQEAASKVRACADLPLRWHFVGQLQTNKAGSVSAYADVVHSVDRERLVAALDRGAHAHGRRVTALVQVRLDDAPGRGGAPPSDVSLLTDLIAGSEMLDLGGVMAVAPAGVDARPAFDRLVEIAHRVRTEHPRATIISAGMSGDLEAAIAAGATHLRVGSAVLGRRAVSG